MSADGLPPLRDVIERHGRDMITDAEHELLSTQDHLGDIVIVAFNIFDDGLVCSHDDSERSLACASDKHRPLKLWLISVDNHLKWFATPNVFCF